MCRIIQSGESQIHPDGSKHWRLDAVNRFVRRLLARPHTSDLPVQSLPFRILTAPRTFTKILLPVIVYLGERGLRVHHYLDNILLLANSQKSLILHRKILLSTLQQFGWLINWKKSNLQPTQKMIFLGAELNTRDNKVELPQEKKKPLTHKMKKLRAAVHLPARACISILGSMSATSPTIQWAQWHVRTFQN